ncbi:MAG TPA: hypothetical protein VKZ75_10010 [Cyclobacteriaceae bacterium]|nr:hypothetical protein [Cyclobacteriaceae bacterium]
MKKDILSIVCFSMTMMLTGCFPEDVGIGNGLSDASMDAAFTIVPDDESPNRFVLKATNTEYIMSKWELGDGSPAFIGNMEQHIFLPDAGTYTITHHAVGKGGTAVSASQDLTVETSDPNSGNLVLGGKLDTEEDIAQWTVLTISSSGASWSFEDGVATITASGYNQQGIYQAINVIKDKTYTIDMVCSSTSGLTDTWFEVFASPVAPVQGNDYSEGGAKRSINTWAGCGIDPFAGKISIIGCGDNTGTFTATADGVMYIVIKSGGGDLKDGVTIDNIEVRGQ